MKPIKPLLLATFAFLLLGSRRLERSGAISTREGILIYVIILLFGNNIIAQDDINVKWVKVNTTYIKTLSRKEEKTIVCKMDDMYFRVPIKHVSKFHIKNYNGKSDTIKLGMEGLIMKLVNKGILVDLLIKRKAYFNFCDEELISGKVYCRYYYVKHFLRKKKLTFADFYLQKEYTFDIRDELLFHYSRVSASFP